mmetsp:Transcript_32940/g.72787  ORF Transcript_32940/g.72787 Transcript_32940/m.72787 type:complete len:344 (+) Transcript_32940:753-1784(+)
MCYPCQTPQLRTAGCCLLPAACCRQHHALASSSCTSGRTGRLGMAPLRRTQMLAAADANLRASAPPLPSSTATAYAAVKQSPAPVVSTTSGAGMAAWRMGTRPGPGSSSEPSAPSLTSTLLTPSCISSEAAACTSSRVCVGLPVSRASSVSLGLSTARLDSRAGEMGPSTPPASRNTGTPAELAICATCTLISSGISLCSSTAPADCSSCLMLSVNCQCDWLAPPTMTMLFSPDFCSRMRAVPLAPCTSLRCMRLTPHPESDSLSIEALASWPTWPQKYVGYPSFAAAAAWLAPFPPGMVSRDDAANVSPGLGRRSMVNTKSAFAEPTTTSGRWTEPMDILLW